MSRIITLAVLAFAMLATDCQACKLFGRIRARRAAAAACAAAAVQQVQRTVQAQPVRQAAVQEAGAYVVVQPSAAPACANGQCRLR